MSVSVMSSTVALLSACAPRMMRVTGEPSAIVSGVIVSEPVLLTLFAPPLKLSSVRSKLRL